MSTLKHREKPADWQAKALSKNREAKAKKIIAAYRGQTNLPLSGKRVLDFGCGNGQISAYIAAQGAVVDAVDVVAPDQFPTSANLHFHKIVPEKNLPFENETFDFVISNMVLPSVEAKLEYLREASRVLKKGGVMYVGAANANFPIDQYYKIPLIHYLGHRPYMWMIRKMGRFSDYIWPNTYDHLTKLFEESGFDWVDLSARIIKHPREFHISETVLRHVPSIVLEALQPCLPVNIFFLSKRS